MEKKKELEMESATEKRDKVHKKINKQFFLLIPVLVALGIGLFIILRETGVINKHVYEEVDNLGEREGVSFDNLLFSYYVGIDRGSQWENRWLCIMNNGDVYAFKWNNELNPWDWYWDGNDLMEYSEWHPQGYDDTNWEKMENAIYLGRFSDCAINRLNCYVENFDINGEYYYLNPPQVEVGQGGDVQQEKDGIEEEDGEIEWRAYGARLYHGKGGCQHIEWCHMNQTWWGGYEKEIQERSLDENAIAAIELFESSGFYDRWVKMCMNGY